VAGKATFLTSVKDTTSPQKGMSKKGSINKDLPETGLGSRTNIGKTGSQSSNLRSGSNAGSRTGNKDPS
jgi:hypothetical protein